MRRGQRGLHTPDAAAEARQDQPAEPEAEESEEPASTGGRDAA
ncbi:hypothetical protein [Streptomyces lydicamycinicus]|nr:hypothetical protein [Streptomyces lydicamycinicus]